MASTPTPANGPQDDDSQEGITVAIRMRPLNHTEGSKERIWKVLPKYSSVTQTTRDGKPLGERVTGRTFFTFDKTFGEEADNRQVYDSVAKGIVSSVVEGLNGTIFAYGQTSSGKTFTMQGSGNLEQGATAAASGGDRNDAAVGGIVHMAAKDIFSQIQQEQGRMFLVRVSFLEIYNEEVRDLLSSNANHTLQIREDPRRGVFVQSVEEIVTDFDTLLKILVHGDKSRTFAATGMNERSSRSHTILRITIESREKEKNMDMRDDYESSLSSGDGAVRISTLNLVDLAGSESVRHTGATGERQKEGGLINQSLLTLSRVIVALGSPNQMHINFRDSKLTRILQPSLSGNARMAVICCATPSELYLEETRSTLQFASRAKLVKTNAQVNEVLDERSMIRRLQKELAEAKRRQSGPDQEQVRDLEKKAATAGTQAMEAKAKLDRLKSSILNAGYLFDQRSDVDHPASSRTATEAQKKRRKSDGTLALGSTPLKPLLMQPGGPTPQTEPRAKRNKVLSRPSISAANELQMVHQALSGRNEFIRDLKSTVTYYSEQIKQKNLVVERIMGEKSALSGEMSEAHTEIESLRNVVAALQEQLESLATESEQALTEKDAIIMDSFEKIQQSIADKEDVERDLADLQGKFGHLQDERVRSAFELAEITSLKEDLLTERASDKMKLQEMAGKIEFISSNLNDATSERDESLSQILQLQLALDRKTKENLAVSAEKNHSVLVLEELQTKLDALQAEHDETLAANENMSAQVAEMHERINEQCIETDKVKEALEKAQVEGREVHGHLSNSMASNEKLEAALVKCRDEKTALEAEVKSASDALAESHNTEEELSTRLGQLEKELEVLHVSQTELVKTHEQAMGTIEAAIVEAKQEVDNERQVRERSEKIAADLKADIAGLETSQQEVEDAFRTLQSEKEEAEARLIACKDELKSTVDSLAVANDEKDVVMAEKNSAEAILGSFKEQILDKESQLAAAEDQIMRLQSEKEAIMTESSDSYKELDSRHDETLKTLQSIQAERDALIESISELESANIRLDRHRQELEAAHAALTSDMEDVQNALSQRDFEKLCVERTLETNIEEMKHAQDAIKKLEVQVDQLIKELSNAEAKNNMQLEKFAGVRDQKEDLEVSLHCLQAELSAAHDENEVFKQALQRRIEQHNEMERDLNQRVTDAINMAQLYEQQLEALRKSLADSQVELERQSMVGTAATAAMSGMQSTVEKLQSELLTLANSNAEKDLAVEAVTAEKNSLIEALQSKIDSTMAEVKARDDDNRVLRQSLETTTTKKAEVEATFVEIKKSNDDLAAENEDIHSRLFVLEEEKSEIELAVATMTAECVGLREEKVLSEARVKDLETEFESLQSKVAQLEEAAATANRSRDALSDSLHDREKERDEATAEIERLYESNRQLENLLSQSLPKEKDAQLQAEISKMKSEILELTHLLASVNDSEERLRNALAATEKKLKLKEAELDDTYIHLSKLEHELAESHSAAIERAEGEEAKENFEKRIEQLEIENRKLEEGFKQQLEAQHMHEEELKKQMGEEQRILIQEAEALMAELRSKIEVYERKLAQLESEAYAARQKTEEISDERKLLEDRCTEAETLNSKLESTVSTLKVELEQYQSECYDLKENVIDMKEKVRRSTRDCEKANRASEIASSELSTYQRKLSSLESQLESSKSEIVRLKKKTQSAAPENEGIIRQLKNDLLDKETKIEQIHSKMSDLTKANEEAGQELELLRAEKESFAVVSASQSSNGMEQWKRETDKLHEELKLKDERIKKLEKNRVTRHQMDAIKKIKEDNANYEKECSKLKKKITSLQSEMASMGSEEDLRAEISELRFDNEALENKLRKFGAHCQRLEDDKAGMVDALRSCNIDMDAYEGDLGEAVIHVCDRLTSIEERHSNQSKQADTMDRLEDENKSLRQKVEHLSRSEEAIRSEAAKLKKLAQEVKSGASIEKDRKIRYLEQENLQLMEDLKIKDKEVRAAHEEREFLRLKVSDQNPTMDFENFNMRSSSSKSRDSISSTVSLARVNAKHTAEFESCNTMELMDLAKAASAGNAGTRSSSSSTKRPTPSKKRGLVDSTNQSSEMTLPPTGKRQRSKGIDLSSSSASSSELPNKLLTRGDRKRAESQAKKPGLGESSSLDTENTGECQQS